ncbi:MAG: YaaR family protein [Leptospiraceae bacterium]|nr:DUF327 family protein [Leptospiraceae bacterium]MCK6379950.1 YaaR family protein [Leptospiraceae bacterium]NUM40090.1 DUF327 family protein [Leptospiraceae bacterium]
MISPVLTEKTNFRDKQRKTLVEGNSSFGSIAEKENGFLAVLESIAPQSNENTAELNTLWRELPEREKNFIDSPTIHNLEEYKSIVRKIIQLIIQKNTKFVLAKRRGETDMKLLHTVKIIDENIHLLATTMISKNNSAFIALKQIEKIRGLLFDISK